MIGKNTPFFTIHTTRITNKKEVFLSLYTVGWRITNKMFICPPLQAPFLTLAAEAWISLSVTVRLSNDRDDESGHYWWAEWTHGSHLGRSLRTKSMCVDKPSQHKHRLTEECQGSRVQFKTHIELPTGVLGMRKANTLSGVADYLSPSTDCSLGGWGFVQIKHFSIPIFSQSAAWYTRIHSIPALIIRTQWNKNVW